MDDIIVLFAVIQAVCVGLMGLDEAFGPPPDVIPAHPQPPPNFPKAIVVVRR